MTLQAPVIHNLVPTLSGSDILTSMGVEPGKAVRPRLQRLVEEVLQISLEMAQPQMVWRMGSTAEVSSAFLPSKRLERYLKKGESAAIIAATSGSRMESRIASETDPMKAYVLGAAATSIARGTLVQARRLILQQNPGKQVADSLSPGTDGLPFKLQLNLFSLLPTEMIGVTLDVESLLMTPLASVTGIVAFGDEVEQPAPLTNCSEIVPHCEKCPSRKCQLRVKPFESKLASA